jgi:PrcB C-terminal
MSPSLIALLAAAAVPVAPQPATVDEQWVVRQVSVDGRTLVLRAVRGGCDVHATPRATVSESEQAVEIRVRHERPQSDGPCAAIAVYDTLRVRLADPIGGRDLVGQSLEQAPLGPRARMPRMLGLRAGDARFALKAHGLRVRGDRAGTVRGQDPRPGARRRGSVTLHADRDPIPAREPTATRTAAAAIPAREPAATRAAAVAIPPLERVPFRSVAKGDGGSSQLERRDALAIRGERRWRRVWRSLTAGITPRPRLPRVDFSRHMLLVAVQGRQPSGGHETTITGVGDTGGRLIAFVDDLSPGPGCITTGAITSPYHVVRVRRSRDPVDFTRHPVERDC